jgi:hypothetical protein
MKKKQEPKYKIGDYVGTIKRSNQWGNAWFEDGGKVVSISYGCVPYKISGKLINNIQFIYTLTNGKIFGEDSLKGKDSLDF